MSRFDMAFDFRDAFGGRPLPQNLPGLLVEAIDLPGMLRYILVRVDVAVKAVPKLALRRGAHRSDDEKPGAPNYGAGVGQAGDLGLPNYIGLIRRVPGCRRVLAIAVTGRVGAAE